MCIACSFLEVWLSHCGSGFWPALGRRQRLTSASRWVNDARSGTRKTLIWDRSAHIPLSLYSGPCPSWSWSSASRATSSFPTWCRWRQVWAWRPLSSCPGERRFIPRIQVDHEQVFVDCGLTLLCCVCPFRSMLPDVVDDFKVKNPDIHGHEALFYSFYVFFIKFASGISLGISTLSLK